MTALYAFLALTATFCLLSLVLPIAGGVGLLATDAMAFSVIACRHRTEVEASEGP